jgi:hypothetical protein
MSQPAPLQPMGYPPQDSQPQFQQQQQYPGATAVPIDAANNPGMKTEEGNPTHYFLFGLLLGFCISIWSIVVFFILQHLQKGSPLLRKKYLIGAGIGIGVQIALIIGIRVLYIFIY